MSTLCHSELAINCDHRPLLVYVSVILNIFPCRISVTEHCHQIENAVFPRGFSSNLIYNVWAVFGGIMMYLTK